MFDEKKELELSVPWGHVSAIAWGSQQDKPVLVVHGTLDNAGSFTRLIKILPKNYYYVAIDLPGHGKSSHYPQGINLDFYNYVLSIYYVIEQLKWKKCFYIGHSFGGQLGIMLSIIHPGIIERIISIDALVSKICDNNMLAKRIKFIQEATIFTMNKNKSTLYTKEQIMDALLNRRDFQLNIEAAEALFDRATTKIDNNVYKLNRDPRMRASVGALFSYEQSSSIINNIEIPILLIVAKESWYDLWNERDVLDKHQKLLGNLLTTIHVDGNHDVHNNNPEFVAPHVTKFFNDAKSKL